MCDRVLLSSVINFVQITSIICSFVYSYSIFVTVICEVSKTECHRGPYETKYFVFHFGCRRQYLKHYLVGFYVYFRQGNTSWLASVVLHRKHLYLQYFIVYFYLENIPEFCNQEIHIILSRNIKVYVVVKGNLVTYTVKYTQDPRTGSRGSYSIYIYCTYIQVKSTKRI